MILAKVQMQFLSGPKFTDVEIVDSCPRYSSQRQLRVGLELLVGWLVGLENSRTALRIS